MKRQTILTVAVFSLAALFIMTERANAQTPVVQCSGPAGTGIVVQPSQGLFTASTDHSAVIPGSTTAILTRYDLEVCDGATLLGIVNLGKPTPAPTTNDITVVLSTLPAALRPAQRVLYFHVVSVGPGGSSRSVAGPAYAFAGPPAAGTALRVQ